MTIISFEIEPSEASRVLKILKAYGVKKLKKRETTEDEVSPDLSSLIEKGRKDLKEGKTLPVTSGNVWERID